MQAMVRLSERELSELLDAAAGGANDGRTWTGPVQIDTCIGAYPSLCELADGSVYCVYYEEGKGSNIRGVRLRADRGGIRPYRSDHKTLYSPGPTSGVS